MSEPQTLHEKPPVRVWRRVWLALGGIVALTAVLGFIGDRYDHARTAGALKSIIEQLDEEDPNWRLADIEANRDRVPEEENSARIIVAVTGGLPKNWADHEFDKLFERLAAEEQLDTVQIETLGRLMKDRQVASVVPSARRLADMPRGHFRVTHAFNPIATLLPEIQEAREACRLLKYDALHLAQAGDIDGALRSGRAAINTARAVGDEPFIISQLVRSAVLAIAFNSIERTLGQGEASEKELAMVQRLLALEDQHRTLLVATRGERAMHYDLFEKLVTGQLQARQLRRDLSIADLPWWQEWFSWRVTRRDQIADLKLMTQFADAARLLEPEQMAAVQKIEGEMKKSRLPDKALSMVLAPGLSKISETAHRKTAAVRTLMAVVAAERFRLETGKWPDTLEQLRPKFLKDMPLDPYTGKALLYKKVADGVVVYAVGKDGADDGGKVVPRPSADEGFRLWDVAKRRQPARPRTPPP